MFSIMKSGLVLGLFLILSISQKAYSQNNFLPGFIVDANGNTLQGEIDFQDWGINPDTISFRKKGETQIVHLSALDVQRFEVNGVEYIGGIFETDISPLKLDLLEDVSAPHILIDTVFLKTIFKSDKKLYLNRHTYGRENFYIDRDGVIELLVYKKYKKYKQIIGRKKELIAENKKFIGQLNLYLRDCSDMQTKLGKIKYIQSSLVSLFEHHASCMGLVNQVELNIPREKTSIDIGVFGGAMLTNINLDGKGFFQTHLVETEFPNSFDPTFGVFIDYDLPRNLRKFSFRTELAYTSYNIYAFHQIYHQEEYYINSDMYLQVRQIRANIMARYRKPIGLNNNIFINVGYPLSLKSWGLNARRIESMYFGQEEKYTIPVIPGFEYRQGGPVFGAGLEVDKFSFELRWEFVWKLTDSINLRGLSDRFYLLAAYRF